MLILLLGETSYKVFLPTAAPARTSSLFHGEGLSCPLPPSRGPGLLSSRSSRKRVFLTRFLNNMSSLQGASAPLVDFLERRDLLYAHTTLSRVSESSHDAVPLSFCRVAMFPAPSPICIPPPLRPRRLTSANRLHPPSHVELKDLSFLPVLLFYPSQSAAAFPSLCAS